MHYRKNIPCTQIEISCLFCKQLWLTAQSRGNILIFVTIWDAQNWPNKCNSYAKGSLTHSYLDSLHTFHFYVSPSCGCPQQFCNNIVKLLLLSPYWEISYWWTLQIYLCYRCAHTWCSQSDFRASQFVHLCSFNKVHKSLIMKLDLSSNWLRTWLHWLDPAVKAILPQVTRNNHWELNTSLPSSGFRLCTSGHNGNSLSCLLIATH